MLKEEMKIWILVCISSYSDARTYRYKKIYCKNVCFSEGEIYRHCREFLKYLYSSYEVSRIGGLNGRNVSIEESR